MPAVVQRLFIHANNEVKISGPAFVEIFPADGYSDVVVIPPAVPAAPPPAAAPAATAAVAAPLWTINPT